MAKNTSFKTIFPAIAIPFNEDESINEPLLRNYVRWLASFDEIGGLVVNGHTGEITGLTRAERKRCVEIVASEVGDRLLIVSGINSENTNEAIEMAKEAKEAGANAILLMPPHMWLRFGMAPDAPVEFFKDVAEGADIDIIVHLYPATSKAFYPVDMLVRMCKAVDHIKAIKMGTRVTAVYENDVRVLKEKCPDVALITCHDETLCTSWVPRMDGALIGFAGCIPEIICKAWKDFKSDAPISVIRDDSDRIFPVSNAIYGEGQPSGEAHARLKEVLVQRGVFENGLMRKPVLPIDQAQKDAVTEGLRLAGLGKVDLSKY